MGTTHIATIDSLQSFAARDGLLIGTNKFPAEWWRVTRPSDSVETLSLPPEFDTASALVFDGSDLFVGGDLGGMLVWKLNLMDLSKQNLAVVNMQHGHVNQVLVDGANIYWGYTYGADGTGALYRSDRNPGTTDTLWSGGSGSGGAATLQAVGGFLYFANSSVRPLATANGQTQLYRMPKDDKAALQTFGAVSQGLSDLVTDGTRLYAGLSGFTDQLGNPAGEHVVVQVSLDDGTLTPIFQAPKGPHPLIVDSAHLYWLTSYYEAPSSLWAGMSNGRGTPVEIIRGGELSQLVQDATTVYVALDCASANDMSATNHIIAVDKQLIAALVDAK
jgi:hypothetical protein